MKKKIATSLEVLINVAQYENIRLAKYGECEIEYSYEEDRIAQENRLNNEVVDDMIACMRSLPERLGKKTEAIQKIEESIKKSVPAWLLGPEPNLAKRAFNNAKADANSQIDKHNEKVAAEKELLNDTPSPATEGESTIQIEGVATDGNEPVASSSDDDADIFGSKKEEAPVEAAPVQTATTAAVEDDSFDVFSTQNLFEDNK